ncbi:hypothetical protein HJC23_002160 [Cyclotella cryptica]|uniref:ethanolamine kinase n=1 Tax=Cyclotella cryptica TaxID=29204 RepID=A0ABD3Q7B1_9STRA|eukprot:CCRYP_008174-RA/>CCRYP_008174-RA protein AED:0.09 eAED:0.09 QI:0/-1/0/1/-1/1/1/0/473
MSPSGYIQSRQVAASSPTQKYFATLVDNRPYLPNLAVDATEEASIRVAAAVTVLFNVARSQCDDKYTADSGAPFHVLRVNDADLEGLEQEAACLSCVRVTGGITNALFRVSGFQRLLRADSIQETLSRIHSYNPACNNHHGPSASTSLDADTLIPFDSILIRIFGAEGMINRDIETSTYAALCRADIAHDYLGRFQNGRIEGWLEGYIPLHCNDLSEEGTSMQIAKEMARLHCLFEVPEGELRDHHGSEVGLWDQLRSWMEHAKGYSEFKTEWDTERVVKLDLSKIEMELNQIIESFTNPANKKTDDGATPGIVFCHNDLLAANIMRDPQTNKIQLIDFEYGGTNYAAFDMANHFNEHAGGTTAAEGATPDYGKFPPEERQQRFCVEYVKMVKELQRQKNGVKEEDTQNVQCEAMELLNQVKEFVLVNHLYWGLWAINQAAEEGCEEFDYITYAKNRFNEFYRRKAEWECDEK